MKCYYILRKIILSLKFSCGKTVFHDNSAKIMVKIIYLYTLENNIRKKKHIQGS